MKNKKETKQKLIQAVGEIIKRKGFAGLKISKIANLAEVDRKLIYRYFTNLDGLIEAYVKENDYWMLFSDVLKEVAEETPSSNVKGLIVAILQNQFRYFYSGKEMQELILWEISQENPLMRSIHHARESYGQKFLAMTDTHFQRTSVNIRAVTALLVGGIYYTILHARFNGGMISDIDINTDVGQDSILKALEQIVGWAFEAADKELL
ncbi:MULTISPECIES: TetR/AcrR family transcriptional regulator [Mucilaginibacter]|nr:MULTISPECIES: TetR/AcrR family transcriptional regulator [Mucilaginibacter]QTE43015.1 TetR/AcrR family transcriptional regulator [Mucilaginibacter rubeus]QTE49616.1 TetR/AcrR family transcriptional regulator [Mucilaginibacter rubeus]QTE54711.1 TetR/AcrR family transcriptional regulator [Mucilaginibacter rubeus]QTE65833.1 TetR/AcrR family transcriptional regulator [Mucilaginibacter rubeus]QTF64584.1 TetR/AcrR family transcriptional regulator [Mucilaginibacter rubeus]